MPRPNNALTRLNAIDAKTDELAKEREEVVRDAHAFVGKLMFDGGLKGWDVKDLKAGIRHLKEIGPEAVRKPGKPITALPAPEASTSAVAAE